MANEKNQRRIKEKSQKNQRRMTDVSDATYISDVAFYQIKFLFSLLKMNSLYDKYNDNDNGNGDEW